MLAAGSARRFGSPKLLAPLVADDRGGAPSTVIASTLASLVSTGWPVNVVVREDDVVLQSLLVRLDVRLLPVTTLPITTQGLGDSIAAGLRALMLASPAPVAYVGIALADMPLLSPALLRTLVEHAGHERIVRPFHTRHERPGHPVIFGSRFFPQLLQCSGDTGAQSVIASNIAAAQLVPTTDDGCLIDIDTPEDLDKARKLV